MWNPAPGCWLRLRYNNFFWKTTTLPWLFGPFLFVYNILFLPPIFILSTLQDGTEWVAGWNRNRLSFWPTRQLNFFKHSMKIYSAKIPNAKFSQIIYRKIAQDYFVLCTGQPREQFNKIYPFNEFWASAGFGPVL